MLRSERDDLTTINVSTLSLFLSFSSRFLFPLLFFPLSSFSTFVAHEIKEHWKRAHGDFGETTRKTFSSPQLWCVEEDAKKRERRHGVVRRGAEDIIVASHSRRLDTISMLRFSRRRRRTSARVFGRDGSGPNTKIGVKTSTTTSSSSSSTMMMVRRIKPHVERETRRRTPVCCWAIAR